MSLSHAKKYIPEQYTTAQQGDTFSFEVPASEIVDIAKTLHKEHSLQLLLITAVDEREQSGAFKIFYIFGAPKDHIFIAPYITATDEFPSITPAIHEAMLHERKIASFFGLTPIGHPELRSIILHENWPQGAYPLRKDFKWNERPEMASAENRTPFTFRHIKGEGIYELPVGPVHAGIIEPGHFRFHLAGEEILLLEPRLGYQHKGTEKLFETLPLDKTIALAERISGDSSFSYALLWCQTIEKLAHIDVSKRAQALRTVYAEFERIANHLGDIGAIMTDTGFNFGGAQGSRLRESVLRINDRLTKSRFLRGVCVLGGVAHDINLKTAQALIEDIKALRQDLSEVIAIADDTLSLYNRLKGTGVLDEKIGLDHGVVGVPLRALGVASDARVDYPYAGYGSFSAVATYEGGDVNARFRVRIAELFNSLELIEKTLAALPKGDLAANIKNLSLPADKMAVSIVEGWRGPIVCFITTDKDGKIARAALRDPSFLNWEALGYAGRGNMVPDFPLINKSFNLSYSGNDL
ncbi:MAG TPA: NADH-quinone oxidoreductase subunit C [Candidatus Paceibacterota bacterium]